MPGSETVKTVFGADSECTKYVFAQADIAYKSQLQTGELPYVVHGKFNHKIAGCLKDIYADAAIFDPAPCGPESYMPDFDGVCKKGDVTKFSDVGINAAIWWQSNEWTVIGSPKGVEALRQAPLTTSQPTCLSALRPMVPPTVGSFCNMPI